MRHGSLASDEVGLQAPECAPVHHLRMEEAHVLMNKQLDKQNKKAERVWLTRAKVIQSATAIQTVCYRSKTNWLGTIVYLCRNNQ